MRGTSEAVFEFQEGGLWEEKPFRIETDYKSSSFGGEPRRHSGPRVKEAGPVYSREAVEAVGGDPRKLRAITIATTDCTR